jgi:tartrate dehydratase alpha subunit/fumarate hydratase class I-like protein
MLPSFLDSVVQLIARTSTDLPPDVRKAMGIALAEEDRSTRAGQALNVIAQHSDPLAPTRSG